MPAAHGGEYPGRGQRAHAFEVFLAICDRFFSFQAVLTKYVCVKYYRSLFSPSRIHMI